MPRWRSAFNTLEAGDLAPLAGDIPPIVDSALLQEKLNEWKATRTVPFASDLVGAGMMSGQLGEVREAAEWLVGLEEQAPLTVRRLASQALGRTRANAESRRITGELIAQQVTKVNPAVHKLRSVLQRYPRNPLAWVDLARSYASLGLLDQADRAIRAAITLAPNSRFALRSAARFFVHRRDPERARHILRASPATSHDPWLLAAEIAVSTVIGGGTSKFVPTGARLMKVGRFPASQTSELAGALGTVEILSGSRKDAKRLFECALIDPTENAVAQAEWANQKIGQVGIQERHFQLPRSFEARARRQYAEGNWQQALEEALGWLEDEPFSSNPAIFGSFVASIIGDAESGADLAVRGLDANPNNPILLNNLVVALANQSMIREAREFFSRIGRPGAEDPDDLAVWSATLGLIEFRDGHKEAGRALYQASRTMSRTAGNQLKHDMATLYLVREELRSPGADTPELVQNLMKELQTPTNPIVRTLLTSVAMEIRGKGLG